MWISHRINKKSLSLFRSMCTFGTKALPKNVNDAKLVGVVTNVYSASVTKHKVFYLRTFGSDHFYDMHKVIVSPLIIEKLPSELKTGQQLFVTGALRTNKFIQESGKTGTSIDIMAKQIYRCDDGDCMKNDENNDDNTSTAIEIANQNKVELFSQICFDINNADTFSSLNLAIDHIFKNSDGVEEERTDFIPVFIYNDNLRNIVRYQLKRLDRVRVEGTLKYKSCINQNGKKQYKGFVVASRIDKLMNLTREQMISR